MNLHYLLQTENFLGKPY